MQDISPKTPSTMDKTNNATELKPMSGSSFSRLQPLAKQLPKNSVGSISGRSASMSEFIKRGVSHASSSAFGGVVVESPKQKKQARRLMFAPVAEVKEVPVDSHPDDEEGEAESQKATGSSIGDWGDDDDHDEDIEDRIEKSVGSNWVKRLLFRIPLMHKALLLVLLPVLALFIMSIIDLSESLDDKSEAEKVVVFTDLVLKADLLAKQYLSTALYALAAIQLPEPHILGPYQMEFQRCQELYHNLTIDVQGLPLDEIYEQTVWEDAMRGFERHELIVRKVITQGITIDELADYYVGTLTSFISSMARGGSLTSDPEIRNAILSTYYYSTLNMYWGWEMAGVLIAQAVGGFHQETAHRLYIQSVVGNEKYTKLTHQMKEFELVRDHFFSNFTQQFVSIFVSAREFMFVKQFDPSQDIYTYLGGLYTLTPLLSYEVSVLNEHTKEISMAAKDDASAKVTFISVGLLFLTLISIFLVALFVSSVNTMTGILQKEVETRQNTEKAVWRFFPQEFISYLNAPDVFHLRPGDRTRLPMTVMFAQIMNFSKLSGESTAEQTYDWLTDFVREMIPIVSQHGGFVDKTTGDGIMALFSTPEGAVYAALEMQAKVKAMNAFGLLSDDPSYDLGIGIHSGEVMLGLLGTRKRLEGTIISDTVNTASRIQGMCKFYGSKIVVSEEVASVVDVESLGCRSLGEVKMKGKLTSMRLYEIFLMDDSLLRSVKQATIEGYCEALELYQSGRFRECSAMAERWIEKGAIRVEDPGLRCRVEFADGMKTRGSVPEGWDGEDIFSQK